MMAGIVRSGMAWMGVLAAAFLAGCSLIGPVHERSTTATAAHEAGSGVEVETRNGAVRIATVQGDTVTVAAVFRSPAKERVDQMSVSVTRTPEGKLKVEAVPAGGKWQDNEGCSLTIGVPTADGVKVRTSNGSIEVAGLGGGADLDTSNGAIEVLKQAGPVKARSSNGSIQVDDAAGSVDATSSNGSIHITLLPDAAGPVSLRTSNGAVTLSVGRAFAGKLSLATSNGNIKVPKDGVAVAGLTDDRGELTFASGGAASTVETSNGGITVTLTK